MIKKKHAANFVRLHYMKTFIMLKNMTVLPKQIKAIPLANRQAYLQGHWPLTQLPRLEDKLIDPQGQVEAQLQFAKNKQGLVTIKVDIHTKVQLECQRCLNIYTHPVASCSHLALVANDEEAKRLPATYEPCISKDGYLSIVDLLSDELLLNLPAIPSHPENCPIDLVKLFT